MSENNIESNVNNKQILINQLIQTKAVAYDIIAEIHFLQSRVSELNNKLNQVNSQIAEQSRKLEEFNTLLQDKEK